MSKPDIKHLRELAEKIIKGESVRDLTAAELHELAEGVLFLTDPDKVRDWAREILLVNMGYHDVEEFYCDERDEPDVKKLPDVTEE